MTEQTTSPEVPPELEISFPYRHNGEDRTRKMWARMPRPEQILVWKRTLNKLQTMPDAEWTADSVMAQMDRTRRIIDTILVNETDVTWLDDQFLDGVLSFKDIMPLITIVVNTFAEKAAGESNRETRRAAKVPAKKAARKKAGA